MSEAAKEENTAVEHVTQDKRTGGKSSRGHCRRFWWIYVIVVIAIAAAIIVPCVCTDIFSRLLVAVPRMAQQKLNEATLSIDGIVITNVETNSLNMAINSTITTDGSTHATIDGFEGTMYLVDTDTPLEFAKINFPETTSDALQTVNVSQEIPISNLGAFTTFNEDLMQKVIVYVAVKGDTHVHVSGISRAYGVAFSKTVPIQGLNGFQGLSVSNPHVSTAQVNNFNATAHIPNPSLLGLDVVHESKKRTRKANIDAQGNVTFHTYFNGSDIGTSYILNMVLHPGPNDFFIWADINQTAIINGLTKRPWCERNGTLTIQLSGKEVTNNGQPIPYFANALAATNVSVDIPIGQAIQNDLGLSLGCLD
ncbi:hypothetical protein K449DRAFT_396401 [Hypoxylon sp. EC38]|nr:hypothetical protein K449DRAFT_396401 [Hypoxylon sp. EC38]